MAEDGISLCSASGGNLWSRPGDSLWSALGYSVTVQSGFNVRAGLKSELELCWPGISVWLGRVLLLEGNCPLALTVLALRADTASHS